MDILTVEALAGLKSSLASLIPPAAEPEYTSVLSIIPGRVHPTGVGGFVGLSTDPIGEIFGRRIEAAVSITIKAGAAEELGVMVDTVTHSLMAAGRTVLAQNGILSLTLEGVGPLKVSGSGNNQITERDLSAQVLYEFLKLPEQASGLIHEVPIEQDLVPGGDAKFLINTGFDVESLNLFDIVDDPKVSQSAPSNWIFNDAEQRIEQLSAIRGGGFVPTRLKAGTYLVLKTASNAPVVQDFILQVRLSSADIDGIGVVFRWQNVDNFYYFLMSSRRKYRMMGRKVQNKFDFLETAALDDSTGYDINTEYELKIHVQGSDFTAFLNNDLVLSGTDTALTEAGRVGFMCHGNEGACFHSMKLTQF